MQQEYQQQLAVLHANVEEVQQAQQALAASTGLRDKPADQDSAARLQGLEQEIDQLREVTHRLERYVEQMLRQMLGTLNSGGLAFALAPLLQCRFGMLQQLCTDLQSVYDVSSGM